MASPASSNQISRVEPPEQSSDTVIRLERRILDRLAGGTAAARRRKSSAADDWAFLAQYAAHLQKEEDRRRADETRARAQRAQTEAQAQQAAERARRQVSTAPACIGRLRCS